MEETNSVNVSGSFGQEIVGHDISLDSDPFSSSSQEPIKTKLRRTDCIKSREKSCDADEKLESIKEILRCDEEDILDKTISVRELLSGIEEVSTSSRRSVVSYLKKFSIALEGLPVLVSVLNSLGASVRSILKDSKSYTKISDSIPSNTTSKHSDTDKSLNHDVHNTSQIIEENVDVLQQILGALMPHLSKSVLNDQESEEVGSITGKKLQSEIRALKKPLRDLKQKLKHYNLNVEICQKNPLSFMSMVLYNIYLSSNDPTWKFSSDDPIKIINWENKEMCRVCKYFLRMENEKLAKRDVNSSTSLSASTCDLSFNSVSDESGLEVEPSPESLFEYFTKIFNLMKNLPSPEGEGLISYLTEIFLIIEDSQPSIHFGRSLLRKLRSAIADVSDIFRNSIFNHERLKIDRKCLKKKRMENSKSTSSEKLLSIKDLPKQESCEKTTVESSKADPLWAIYYIIEKSKFEEFICEKDPLAFIGLIISSIYLSKKKPTNKWSFDPTKPSSIINLKDRTILDYFLYMLNFAIKGKIWEVEEYENFSRRLFKIFPKEAPPPDNLWHTFDTILAFMCRMPPKSGPELTKFMIDFSYLLRRLSPKNEFLDYLNGCLKEVIPEKVSGIEADRNTETSPNNSQLNLVGNEGKSKKTGNEECLALKEDFISQKQKDCDTTKEKNKSEEYDYYEKIYENKVQECFEMKDLDSRKGNDHHMISEVKQAEKKNLDNQESVSEYDYTRSEKISERREEFDTLDDRKKENNESTRIDEQTEVIESENNHESYKETQTETTENEKNYENKNVNYQTEVTEGENELIGEINLEEIKSEENENAKSLDLGDYLSSFVMKSRLSNLYNILCDRNPNGYMGLVLFTLYTNVDNPSWKLDSYDPTTIINLQDDFTFQQLTRLLRSEDTVLKRKTSLDLNLELHSLLSLPIPEKKPLIMKKYEYELILDFSEVSKYINMRPIHFGSGLNLYLLEVLRFLEELGQNSRIKKLILALKVGLQLV